MNVNMKSELYDIESQFHVIRSELGDILKKGRDKKSQLPFLFFILWWKQASIMNRSCDIIKYFNMDEKFD